MVIVGLALFIVASCAGGVAPGPLLLFAGRSGQGISAALAIPAAMSLLVALFPSGSNRNRALGVWTAAGAAGGAAGFAAGGIVTDVLGWRWIFLLNVPIVLVALIVIIRLSPPEEVKPKQVSLDVRGTVLLVSGLLGFILGLSRLRTSSGTIHLVTNLVVLFCGIVLLVTFVLVERSSDEPLIPMRLLRLRSVVGASLVAFILTFTTTSASVILTLYLQRILEVEPTRSGILLSPVCVAVVAGSVAGSRYASARGFGMPMVVGLMAISTSMPLFMVGMQDGSLTWIVSGLVVTGVGLGCASVAATACGLSSIGESDSGITSGLITSMAMLGTATGIVSLGAIAAFGTSFLASQPDSSDGAQTTGFQLAIAAAGALALTMAPVAMWSVHGEEKVVS